MPEEQDTEQREPVAVENAGQTDIVSAPHVHDTQAATEATEVVVKRKRGRPHGYKTTHSNQVKSRKQACRMAEMKLKGASYEMIARAEGVSRRAVVNALKMFEPIFVEIKNLKTFREVKTDLIDATQLRLLKSMNDEDKISKASLNNVAYAFTQMHQAGRLERGQSTANVHSKQETHSTILKRSE
jgi:predicted DNA-binding protein YlxM (UPF0122 family)